jgi:hypothetical protein
MVPFTDYEMPVQYTSGQSKSTGVVEVARAGVLRAKHVRTFLASCQFGLTYYFEQYTNDLVKLDPVCVIILFAITIPALSHG